MPIIPFNNGDQQGTIDPQTGLSSEPKSPKGNIISEDLFNQIPDVQDYERRGIKVSDYEKYVPQGNVFIDEGLEDARAYGQSTGEQWGRGLLKFVGKTGTATLGGTIGTVAGLPNIFIKDKSVYDNAFQQAMDTANEWMDEKLANYSTSIEKEEGFLKSLNNANFWANDVLGGLSFTAGAVLSEMVWGAATAGLGTAGALGRAGRYLKNFSKADDVAKQLGKIGRTKKLSDAGRTMRQMYTGAGYEAGVEARQHKKELTDLLKGEWLADNPDATAVPTEELARINDMATTSANGVFAANVGVVGLSNMIALPRIFGPGIRAQSSKFKNIIRAGTKDLEAGIKAGKQAFTPAYTNTARLGKIAEAAYLTAKNPFVEGVWEEGMQGVANNTMLDYTTKKYNSDGTDSVVDLMESFGNGLVETYGGKQGWKEIGIGMIIGGIGSPNFRAYKRDEQGKLQKQQDQPIWTGGIAGEFQERNLQRREADRRAAKMNTFTQAKLIEYMNANPDVVKSTRSLTEHLIRSATLNNEMDTAMEAGNTHEAKNVEADMIHSYIMSRIDGGHAADLKQEFAQAIEDMTDEEYAAMFEYNDMTEKELQQRKQETLESFNKRVDSTIEMTKLVDSTFQADLTNKANNDIRESLIYAGSTINNVEQREQSVANELFELTGVTYDPSERGEKYKEEFAKEVRAAVKKNAGKRKVANALVKDLDKLQERRERYLDQYNRLFTTRGQEEYRKLQEETLKDLIDRSIKEEAKKYEGTVDLLDRENDKPFRKYKNADGVDVISEVDEEGNIIPDTEQEVKVDVDFMAKYRLKAAPKKEEAAPKEEAEKPEKKAEKKPVKKPVKKEERQKEGISEVHQEKNEPASTETTTKDESKTLWQSAKRTLENVFKGLTGKHVEGDILTSDSNQRRYYRWTSKTDIATGNYRIKIVKAFEEDRAQIEAKGYKFEDAYIAIVVNDKGEYVLESGETTPELANVRDNAIWTSFPLDTLTTEDYGNKYFIPENQTEEEEAIFEAEKERLLSEHNKLRKRIIEQVGKDKEITFKLSGKALGRPNDVNEEPSPISLSEALGHEEVSMYVNTTGVISFGTETMVSDKTGFTFIRDNKTGNIFEGHARNLNAEEIEFVIKLFKSYIGRSTINEKGLINSDNASDIVSSNGVVLGNIWKVLSDLAYWTGDNMKEDADGNFTIPINENDSTRFHHLFKEDISKDVKGGMIQVGATSYPLFATIDGQLALDPKLEAALRDFLSNRRVNISSRMLKKKNDKFNEYTNIDEKGVVQNDEIVEHDNYQEYLAKDVVGISVIPANSKGKVFDETGTEVEEEMPQKLNAYAIYEPTEDFVAEEGKEVERRSIPTKDFKGMNILDSGDRIVVETRLKGEVVATGVVAIQDDKSIKVVEGKVSDNTQTNIAAILGAVNPQVEFDALNAKLRVGKMEIGLTLLGQIEGKIEAPVVEEGKADIESLGLTIVRFSKTETKTQVGLDKKRAIATINRVINNGIKNGDSTGQILKDINENKLVVGGVGSMNRVHDYVESLQPKKPTEFPKGKKKFNRSGNEGGANMTLYRTPTGDPRGIENMKKAEAWFKERFPGVDFNTLQHLIDGKHHGQLRDAAVYIFNNAEIGTTYHEAFHVVTQMFLNRRERRALYREYRQRVPDHKDYTDLQVEEVLAEEFREYILFRQETSSTTKQGTQKTQEEIDAESTEFRNVLAEYSKSDITPERKAELEEKLMEQYYGEGEMITREAKKAKTKMFRKYEAPIQKSFFERLYDTIINFFYGKPESIMEIFDNIESNKYRNQTPNLRRGITLNRSYNERDEEFTNASLEGLNFFFFKKLFADENNIDSLFAKEGNTELLTSLYDYAKGEIAKRRNDLIDKYEKTTDEIEEGYLENIIEGLGFVLDNWAETRELHKRFLAQYKLEIITPEDYIPENDTNNDPDNQWANESIKISSKMSASRNIRLLLGTLAELDQNGNPKMNILELPQNADFGRTFNVLTNKLAGARTANEMKSKMNEILTVLSKKRREGTASVPDFTNLIKRLGMEQEGRSLSKEKMLEQIQFVQVFAKTKNTYVFDITGQNGKFVIVNSNSTSIAEKIKQNWINNGGVKDGLFDIVDSIPLYKTTYFDKLGVIDSPQKAIDMFKHMGITFTLEGEVMVNPDFVTKAEAIRKQIISKRRQPSLFNKEVNTNAKGDLDFLIELERNTTVDYIENSHYNIDKNLVYDVVLNSYLSTIVDDINKHDTIEEFLKENPHLEEVNNWYTMNSFLLEYGGPLYDKNGKLRDKAVVLQIHEGSKEEDADAASEFEDLSPPDQLRVHINNGLLGSFPLLRPADNSIERYLSFGKPLLSNTDIAKNKHVELMIGYLKDEMKRSDVLLAGENANWYNIQKNMQETDQFTGKVRGYNNGILMDIISNNPTIKTALDDFFANEDATLDDFFADGAMVTLIEQAVVDYFTLRTNRFLRTLSELGIVSPTEDGKYWNFGLNIQDNAELVSADVLRGEMMSYLINDTISNIEQTKLFFSDPINYKSITDEFKRHSGLVGTKKISAVYEQVNQWIEENLKRTDRKHALLKDGKPIIRTTVFADVIVESRYHAEYAREIGDKASPYAKMEEGDGQGYISIDEWREMLFRAGEWSFGVGSLEDLYQWEIQKEADLESTPTDPDTGREIRKSDLPVANPLKPQHMGPMAEDGFVMGFYKLSLLPLLPSVTRNFSQLEALRKSMKRTGTGIAAFQSANKVGTKLNKENKVQEAYKINKATKRGEFAFETDDFVTQDTYYKYWGIQQDMGSKVKKKVVSGTQMAKQIINGIYENGKPKNEKLGELAKEYQTLNSERIAIGLAQFIDSLGLKESKGQYVVDNIDDLIETFKKEAIERDLPDNIIDGIENLREGNGIDSLVNSKKLENILLAIADSMSTSQKRSGSAKVQVANAFGKLTRTVVDTKTGQVWDSSDLKFYSKSKDGKTVSQMEVYLPAYLKGVVPEGKLKDLIGFRIPTQGLNSIESITVKGFLPAQAGDSVIVPSEMVAKSGSDYDIDKLNVYYPNAFYDKDGNPQYIEHGTAEELEADYADYTQIVDVPMSFQEYQKLAIENRISEIQKEIILHPDNFEQLINPVSSEELSDEAKEIRKLRGEPEVDIPTMNNIVEREYLMDVARRFIGGKQAVGITAIFSTFDILSKMNDVSIGERVAVYRNKKVKSISTRINLPHNSRIAEDKHAKVEISLSKLTDKSGEGNIPERLSQWIGAAVDAAKDPFMFDLNSGPDTLNTVLYLTTAGVPLEFLTRFMTQPIIVEYIKNRQKWESQMMEGNTDATGKSKKKYRDEIVELTKRPYEKFGNKYKRISEFSIKELEDSIKKGARGTETEAHFKRQLQILDDFLRYQDTAKELGNAVRAIAYDTKAGGKNTSELTYRLRNTENIKLNTPVNNFDAILEEGFITPYFNAVNKLQSILNPLFNTLNDPAIVKQYDKLFALLFNIKNNTPVDKKIRVLDKFKNNFLSHLIITRPYMVNGELVTKDGSPLPMNTQVDRLFKGSNSIAHRLVAKKKQFAKEGRDFVLFDHLEANVSSDGSTHHVISRAKKLDNIDSNRLTGEWTELFESDPAFAHDLMIAAFLQYGLTNTPYSYTDLIPAKQYGEVINSVVEYEASNTQKDSMYEEFFEQFFLNNVDDHAIVPKETSPLAKIFPYYKKYEKKKQYKGVTKKKLSELKSKNVNIWENRPRIYRSSDDVEMNTGSASKDYRNDRLLLEYGEGRMNPAAVSKKTIDSTEEDRAHALFQVTPVTEEAPSESINELVKGWLAKMGIKYENVENITTTEGEPIDAIAKADLLHKIVQVAEGKADITTLPEEAAHFLVELLGADNPIFRGMMNVITEYPIYDEVVAEYGELYGHDETKLKKEAVGKMIARAIINKEEVKNISRFKKWFDSAWRWIKKHVLGVKSSDIEDSLAPFAEAANIILGQRTDGLEPIESLQPDVFYQVSEEERNQRDIVDENLQENRIQRDIEEGGYKTAKGKVKNRVSELKDEFFKKIFRKPNQETEYSNLLAAKGTILHKYLEVIGESLFNGKEVDMETVQKKVIADLTDKNDVANEPFIGKSEAFFKLTGTQFGELRDGLTKVVEGVQARQKKIDPKGTVKFFPEIIIYDQFGDVGGTIDLAVLYSNGAVGVYDYKGINFNPKHRQVSLLAEDAYNIQIAEYKKILKDRYGVKEFAETRIIPIDMQMNESTNGYASLAMGATDINDKARPYLEHIPVAREETEDKALNLALRKLFDLYDSLRADLSKDPYNEEIATRASHVKKQIREIQLNRDVSFIYGEIRSLYDQFAEREILPIDHPEYLHNDKLRDFREMIKAYEDFGINAMATAKSQEDIPLIQDLERIAHMIGSLQRRIEHVERENINRESDYDVGATAKAEGFMGRLFKQLSQFNRPVFKKLSDMIHVNSQNVRTQVDATVEDIGKKTDTLKEWARARGKSLQDAFDMIIITNDKDDPKLRGQEGGLVKKFSQKFYDNRNTAREVGDKKWFLEHTQIEIGADGRLYYIGETRKEYDEKRKKYHDYIKRTYPGDERREFRNEQLRTWDNKYNITDNQSIALYNTRNYLIRPQEAPKNYSDQYNFMLRVENKPLLDYYNTYVEYNKKFAEMTGKNINENFIAEISKDLMDMIGETGVSGLTGIWDNIKRSIEVREFDLQRGSIDPATGKQIQAIPLFYTDKLKGRVTEKDREKIKQEMLADETVTVVEGTDKWNKEFERREKAQEYSTGSKSKSKDLSRSLILFAETAYSYEQLKNSESTALALREMMKASDQETELVDGSGKKFLNAFTRKTATMLGVPLSEQQAFEQFINLYWYGQTMQGGDRTITVGGKTYSASKAYQNIMKLTSATALGLKPLLAAGNALGIKSNYYMTGWEGRYYTKEDIKNTHKLLLTRNENYALGYKFFEPYTHNLSFRKANNLSASKTVKFATFENLFILHRVGDEMIDRNITISMMQRFGIDSDGVVKRLDRIKGEDKRSLLERGKTENDKYSIEGLSEEQYIRFRRMIQRAAVGVKGNMPEEDRNLIGTTLTGQALMQFRNWMPGLITKRFKDLQHDELFDEYDVGRFRVFFGEFTAKGLMPKLGAFTRLLGEVTMMNLYNKKGINMEVTEKYYNKYMISNPDSSLTLEEFVELRKAKLQGMAKEIQILLGFVLLVTGGKAFLPEEEDDPVSIAVALAAQNMFRMSHRGLLELSFFFSPKSVTTILKSPVPSLRVFNDISKMLRNSLDETRDFVIGEESKQDKTPAFYYISKLVPVSSSAVDFFDIFDTYNKDRGY